ncbi:heterokaryon incompatibility protein [Colletotrichum salicis]|uniref:Heterokaryon incompatibility protein n=1 Tax=Colletotrichum salicis TaxID=1209931 RepID=A0A135UMB2_9PEZI|nr:heterokaryon incompatibility protein [Colletotrichum salicis]
MTASLEDYQYQALSTFDSVRLLGISKDDNHPHGLCLSLEEVSLDEESVFAALSYTWQLPKYGNPEQTQEPGPGRTFKIVCDGRSMEMFENLFDFLRTILEFRCLPKDDADRASATTPKCPPKVKHASKSMPLWIDAFCINQTNNEEKKHQVLLMYRIYSAAQNVLVWLGLLEPDPEVQWIHDKFIPRLSQALRKPESVTTTLHKDTYCRKPEVRDLLGPDTCSRWGTSWFILAKFLRENRRFDRGWVVQEVSLADPAQTHTMCGKVVLNWKRLGALVQFLHEARWSQSLEANIERSFEHVKLFSEVQALNKPQIYSSRHLSIGGGLYKINGVRALLAELVFYMETRSWNMEPEPAWLACASFIIFTLRSFHFGDDRDHIHGSLGMLSMLLPQGFSSPIVPDYDQSVEDVFTSVAACFIERLPLLSELRHVGKEKARRYTALPSWVPDYSVPNASKMDRHKRHNGIPHTKANVKVLKRCEAAIWRRELRRPSVVGHKLVLHGMKMGTILSKAHEHFTPESSYEMAFTMVGYFRTRPFEALCQPQLNLWDRLEAAVLNECLELYALHLQPVLSLGFDKSQRVEYYVPGRREFVHTRLNESEAGHFIPKEIYAWAERFQILGFPHFPRLYVDQQVWEELDNECFYRTSRQGLGLGSPFAVEHDQIWFDEGASVPFVLREVTPAPRTAETGTQTRVFRYIGDIELSELDVYSSELTSEQHRQQFEEISII